MKKRSHENTRRLTARERATAVCRTLFGDDMYLKFHVLLIQKAIQAAVRGALARNDRRAKKGR